MPPSSIRGICWLRHATKPDVCDQENHSQSSQAKSTGEVSILSLSDSDDIPLDHECSLTSGHEIHKLVAWTAPPYNENIKRGQTQYYYLTFNATPPALEDYGPKLTAEFSLSSDVAFSNADIVK